MFLGYFIMGERRLSVNFNLFFSFTSNMLCSFKKICLHNIFKISISFIYFVYTCILYVFLVSIWKEAELIFKIICGEKKGDKCQWLLINSYAYFICIWQSGYISDGLWCSSLSFLSTAPWTNIPFISVVLSPTWGIGHSGGWVLLELKAEMPPASLNSGSPTHLVSCETLSKSLNFLSLGYLICKTEITRGWNPENYED